MTWDYRRKLFWCICRTDDGPTGVGQGAAELTGNAQPVTVEELHQVAATRTERRLFAQVDFRHEMRPIAFVDPGTFIVQVTRASRLFDLVAQQFFDIADAVANVVQFLSDAQ